MMQLLIEALTIIIPLTAIMVTLFAWLRQDIKAQGDRLDKRIDVQSERLDKRLAEQGRDIKTLIADGAALKATVETFFRLRVDPPQPPDNPGADQADKAA